MAQSPRACRVWLRALATRLTSVFSGGRGSFLVALGGRLLLGLRQACAARGDAPDFSGMEQHATSDAYRLELSGPLQPEKRGFTDLEKCKSLGAREKTRASRLLRDLRCDQVASPFQNAPKRGATEGSYTSSLV
jgi:hypothetical protein